jgi:hypothetical protein
MYGKTPFVLLCHVAFFLSDTRKGGIYWIAEKGIVHNNLMDLINLLNVVRYKGDC